MTNDVVLAVLVVVTIVCCLSFILSILAVQESREASVSFSSLIAKDDPKPSPTTDTILEEHRQPTWEVTWTTPIRCLSCGQPLPPSPPSTSSKTSDEPSASSSQ